MNKTRCTLSVLAAFLFVMTCASAGKAVAFRTFVAAPPTGNDANVGSDCPVSAPCRNFSTAYGVTSVGGEIVALSSAGYGGLTVGHAITIQSIPGVYAFIGVVPGTAGIVVSPGASETVVLRNIQFSGNPSNGAGSIGVQHNSGKLLIENCTFTLLGTGVQVNNAKADIIGSDIVSNTIGVATNGAGYDPNCQGFGEGQGQWPGSNTTQARLERGTLSNNGTALQMNNPGSRHANCFCTPVCSFATPVPSINPTQNLITFLMHSTYAGDPGITMNVTGNTTFVTGTGASCTATPGMCNAVFSYSSTSNPH